MERWTGIVGLALAAIMVLQMTFIIRRQNGSWRRTALFYKGNILFTVATAFVGWLVLFVLAVSQPIESQNRAFFRGYDYLLGKTEQVTNTIPIANNISGTANNAHPEIAGQAEADKNSSPWRTSAIIILIAFFTGAIRLLFEQSADDPRTVPVFLRDFFRSFFRPGKLYGEVYRLNPKELGESAKQDSWVWWFVITVVLALFPDKIPFGPHERLRAVIVTSIAFVGYFTWIYVGLHNKLTKGHNFSALASRAFLGDLLNQYVPLQAVVIGPRAAGKTCFIRAVVVRNQDPTRVPEVHLFQASQAKISVVDTPGENLGDHLLIVAKYRTDTLVLLLDVRHIMETEVKERSLFTEKDCPRLFKDGTSSKTYLERFISATESDANALPKKDVFKVLSFMLFLNYRESDVEKLQPTIDSLQSDDRLQKLAQSLGRRFGVGERECCAIIAPAPQEGIARGLIAIDPELRLATVHGPSGQKASQKPEGMQTAEKH